MPRADRFITVNDVELHYSEWGSPTDPPVLCVHGLSRVGRDFDPLASQLAATYHVLCPDMPGRGLSEWADHPDKDYTGPALVSLLIDFYDRLNLESIRWIGTSMGGTLGIALAGGPLQDRISHLVVNDVGPDPVGTDDSTGGVERIIEYLSSPPTFDRYSELEEYYREVYATFSPMTDDEWRRLTITSGRRRDDGQITPNYDPRVVEPLLLGGDTDQWDAWDAITADIFILHGRDSDILTTDTVMEMQSRQPDAQLVEIDCGHAPTLNVPDQIDPLREFLTT